MMQDITCPDWLAFVEFISTQHTVSRGIKHGVLWRGHASADWLLESSVERIARSEYIADNKEPTEWRGEVPEFRVNDLLAVGLSSFSSTLDMHAEYGDRSFTPEQKLALC